ncbi:hypothetical protein NDU88_007150 [Pleurodeles waltl]|uniref:Uncharacterized protein n=1 Tax=Pleurodeles waltl TaxID=8319 RepID=A0AAV7MHV5_PLEWA|nr:hypothetical protein NDU88_007150 [Pleurodeles waltl]
MYSSGPRMDITPALRPRYVMAVHPSPPSEVPCDKIDSRSPRMDGTPALEPQVEASKARHQSRGVEASKARCQSKGVEASKARRQSKGVEAGKARRQSRGGQGPAPESRRARPGARVEAGKAWRQSRSWVKRCDHLGSSPDCHSHRSAAMPVLRDPCWRRVQPPHISSGIF